MPTFTNADIYKLLSTKFVHVDFSLIYIGFSNFCPQNIFSVD